ncbi:MAG: GntR family transcriptional regulator [Acidimicrobiales bacterium]
MSSEPVRGCDGVTREVSGVQLERLPASDRITDVVYNEVRDAIVSGRLTAGSRLSVPALASALGVSRSPVREAVVRLTHERLAREAPRRGAIVAEVGLRELATLYEVREVLEGLAARLASRHSNPDLASSMRTLLRHHEEALHHEELSKHVEYDMEFHGMIRRVAQNRELMRLLDNIQTQVRVAMLTTAVSAGPRQALADHVAIYERIADGDSDGAERAAREHVVRLREALLHQAGADKNEARL